jgi:hypothetical protein
MKNASLPLVVLVHGFLCWAGGAALPPTQPFEALYVFGDSLDATCGGPGGSLVTSHQKSTAPTMLATTRTRGSLQARTMAVLAPIENPVAATREASTSGRRASASKRMGTSLAVRAMDD